MAAIQATAQVTPGQVGDTLKRPPELRPVPAAPAVDRDRAAPATSAGGRRIEVQRFEFSGNTLYGEQRLQELIADYVSKPLSLSELYAAADRIADFYAAQGFTLASVSLPPQKITDGVVLLAVSEGRIGKLLTEGHRSYDAEQLTGYLQPIESGRVYRGVELEQRLRALNALPGLRARAVLSPGADFGSSDLTLRVEERRYEGTVAIDNHGRDNIGELRASALGRVNNPFGIGDQLELFGLGSEDGLLTYAYGSYSLPLTRRGLRLSLSYGQADFEVEDAPVEGVNRNLRIALDQPLLQTRNENLRVGAALSHTDADSDFVDQPLNETVVTLLEAFAQYTRNHANSAVTQVVLGMATNFSELTRQDILDAQASSERLRANQRLRLDVDILHLHPLPAGLQALARFNGVYSPDPLVDTQQASLGGPGSVRGFAASEIRGDNAVFGSLTLQRPFATGALQLLPRAFVDSGQAFVVNAPAGVSGSESLTSVGIGIDLRYQALGLRLDWSFPQDSHVADDGDDDSRLFGTLSASF